MDASPIPRNLHEFISKSVDYLKNVLRSPMDNHPLPNVVNILWFNPLLGAEFHFASWKGTERMPKDAGINSEYFKKLIELAPLPVPGEEDIENLVEYSIRSPTTVSSLLPIQKDLAEILGLSHFGHRSLIRELIKLFCDCVATEIGSPQQKFAIKKIIALAQKELLFPVIYTFLGTIPQYRFAKGQLLFSEIEKGGKSWVWVDPGLKKEKWQEAKQHDDPSTSMFCLLSVVESLQWASKDQFFIVANLYEFIRDEYDEIGLLYAEHQRLLLSRLSLYLTANPRNESQKKAIKDTFRVHIRYWIAPLCSLLRAVDSVTLRHSLDLHDEVYNWGSERWARGLLGVSKTRELEFAEEYLNEAGVKEFHGGKRVIFSESDLKDNNLIEGEGTELGKSLISPWGIYKKKEGFKVQEDNGDALDSYTPFYCDTDQSFKIIETKNGLRTWVICSLDVSNDEFRDAVANGRFCVRDQLHDVSLFTNGILAPSASEWFKKAFGLFYYYFDMFRHETPPTIDLQERKDQEAKFYIKELTQLTESNHGVIRDVLDIGIGYGRLLKKIHQEGSSGTTDRISFWGLDVSLEMQKRSKQYLEGLGIALCYKIGEMIEVKDIFADKKFDAVFLTYTTFGCYDTDEKNESALKHILDVIKPGGLLILEQFNPNIEKAEKNPWKHKEIIDKRKVNLLKTTYFVPAGDHCKLYTGEYVYSSLTPEGPEIIRRDGYCLRLYSPSWFRRILEPKGFSNIDFQNGFTGKTFTGEHTEKIMLCVARKDETKSPTEDRIDSIIQQINDFLETLKTINPTCLRNVEIDGNKVDLDIFDKSDSTLRRNLISNPPDCQFKIPTNSKGEMDGKELNKILKVIARFTLIKK